MIRIAHIYKVVLERNKAKQDAAPEIGSKSVV